MKTNSSKRISPEFITELDENEVFVFGSNLDGMHAGGAAKIAHNSFGAVWGEGVGFHGRSYAIPTMHGGLNAIKPYVDDFIEFARINSEMIFLVTRVGCGIAGFRDEEMAPLFREAVELENVYLPEIWWEILN